MIEPQNKLSQPAAAASDPTLLRLAAGTIYFYFGFLKFFPDLSPAELLAGQSIMKLSWYMIDAHTALIWLAIMECAIGICFLFNIMMRWLLYIFLFHQISTFLPLFMFPEITFKIAPFAPTMEGQYIIKNLISLAAGWTVMLPSVKANWSRSRRRSVAAPASPVKQVPERRAVRAATTIAVP